MIQVSVIIPVYNRPSELRRALESVLKQSAQEIEVLVADDCSEVDLLNEVILPLNDERIRFLKSEKKGNANVSRNLGTKEAKGKYIAYLDSDDVWLPEHLEKRIEMIEKTGADGLYGSHYLDNGEIRKAIFSRARRSEESMADYLLTDGVAQTSSYFLKAEAAKEILWDESLRRHQDYDFSIRFAENFRFEPCTELTVVVHWEKGVPRAENFDSQIQFIEKHKHSISPRVYNQYHYRAFFQAAGRNDVSLAVVNHFKRESYRYPSYLTLTEYLAVAGYGKSAFGRLLCRFRFALMQILRFK